MSPDGREPLLIQVQAIDLYLSSGDHGGVILILRAIVKSSVVVA